MIDSRTPQALIRVNGKLLPFRSGTVSDLLRRSEIDPRASGIAVALNGDIVPRSVWPTRHLSEGDEVEIVCAVQGG